MATYEELMNAARNADAAGDGEAAGRLVKMAQAAQPQERMPIGAKIATALNMAGEGLTFGLVGDEAAARFDAMIGRGSYDDRLDLYRGNEEQFREENPIAATASQVLPSMAVPGLGIAKTAGLLGKAGVGAASGAAGGGLFGFMEGEGVDDRLAGLKQGALIGGALGGAAPIAGRQLGKAIDNVRGSSAVRKAARAAPTRDQLEAQASALFEQTKGAQLPRPPLQAAAQKMTAEAVDGGMDAMLTPSAARVASNITDVANDAAPTVSMREMNVMRRQAQVPAGNVTNRTEMAVGSKMINAIDSYVDEVAPQLGEQGKTARAMWSTLRKSDNMDEIFKRAEMAASGFENGLKVEFRRILKNPRLRRGYSKAEQAAMMKVVSPGLLPSIIRQVGRLGVSMDNGSNALGGALGAGLGGSVGGIGGAMAVPAIGTAARKASEVMTQKSAQRVKDIIRAPNTQLPAITNQAQGLLDDLMVRMGRGVAINQ